MSARTLSKEERVRQIVQIEIGQDEEAVGHCRKEELLLLQMSGQLSGLPRTFASHRLYAFQKEVGGEVPEGETPGT